jgi:hypothetical protein
MLKASFVRTAGERDRIYVTRSDGTEVAWAFPSYGDAPPHDLIHLAAESGFGLSSGFWGRVDAGADPGRIDRQANRRSGPDRYAGFGEDLSELQLAEAVANPRWLAEEVSLDELQRQIVAGCRDLGVATPTLLSKERVGQVRAVVRRVARQWRELAPKGALLVSFDAKDPVRGFEQLLEPRDVVRA